MVVTTGMTAVLKSPCSYNDIASSARNNRSVDGSDISGLGANLNELFPTPTL